MSGNDQSAGATPAVEGATPSQTTPVSPAAATTSAQTPPVTGDGDALGDGGKRALESERTLRRDAEERAKAAEKERDDLKAAGLSDNEKALKAAKAEGASEVLVRVHAQIRRSEVRAALTAEGINASVLDLATKADEFAALKVSDEGEVTGLSEAIKAFKTARPDLFTKAPAVGTAEGGNRGGGSTLTLEAIKKMSPAEVNARWDEVSKVLAAQ